MSNPGDRRDDEPRETADDAGRVSSGELDDARVDASPAEPAEARAGEQGDTAVYDEPLIDPSGRAAADATNTGEQPAAPAEAATTPPAEPGPVGPGDTAVVEPAAVRTSQAPTSVEPPVGTGRAVPASEAEPVAEPPAEPADDARREPADAAEPGAPVDDEPADAQSRLDAAVQRANAVPVASADRDEAAADRDTPDPVAADTVRRETYVPPAAGGAAVGAATLAGEPQPPQTVYVQAPTPPKRKTNRGFGVLVALIGTAAFALLYAGVAYLLFWGQYGSESTEQYLEFLSRATFWVPIIATFVGFALLAVIVNRGAWWKYAVFGLLVGVLTYFSYIGAVLLVVRAWELTPQEAADTLRPHFLSPLAIAAGVIAREIPIWFGGWIAKRGRGVAERNRLAMEAYDRELAAGPRPVSR
jgi:hypothetical protein